MKCTVFNSPEIWTNSSAHFLGVEISIYPLLRAIRNEGAGTSAAEATWDRCRALLKKGASLEGVLARAEDFLASPVMAPFRDIGQWPQHNGRDQAEAMLAASADLVAMSADPKNPVCAELSRSVFQGVGRLMFDTSWDAPGPVLWLNHDVVAKRLGRAT